MYSATPPNDARFSRSRRSPAAEVKLLSMFRIVDGGHDLLVGEACQRLIAFLALQDEWLRRLYVAAMLWPDATEKRAATSLRSALSRLRASQTRMVESSGDRLRLATGITVDLQRTAGLARRLTSGHDTGGDESLMTALYPDLLRDLLPDWYEDWLVLPQEQWRQLRVHALEALADRLTRSRRFAEAVEVSLSAVAADRLRESPYRCVIRAHLAEGNWAEAQRQYLQYRSLAREELGIEPSPHMHALVADGRLTSRRPPDDASEPTNDEL